MSEKENMEEARKIMETFAKQTERFQGGYSPNTPMPSDSIPPGTNEFDNQGGEFAPHGDGNDVGTGFDNQGTHIEEGIIKPANVQTLNPNTTLRPAHTQPTPTLEQRPDVCPQCKSMHPPLRPGEKCPNAGVGDTVSNAGLDDAAINKHLVDLRNIILSNMNSKGVKDGKKFFQYAVLELTKILENYSE